MAVWKQSTMTAFYYASESEELACTVKIDDDVILVEYELEGDLIQYWGKNDGTGHFKLDMQKPGTSGEATLHMFPDSSILEGYWREDSYRGMWRIKLA